MDGEIVATRNSLGRFQPGASGNPGGRTPMEREVKEILQAASPLAARRLVELLDDPDPVIRLKAIDMLQNRIYGRPAQQMDKHVTQTNVQQEHLRVLMDIQSRRQEIVECSADATDAAVADITSNS
jgi:hypothetical protein